MIIFGSRSSVRDGGAWDGDPCPYCGHQAYRTYAIVRYVHLYFIPFFPTTTTLRVECLHCLHAREDDNIPREFRSALRSKVVGRSQLLFSMIGPITIALLVVYGVISERVRAWGQENLLEAPAPGDVYVVDAEKLLHRKSGKYALMKLELIGDARSRFSLGSGSFERLVDARDACRIPGANVSCRFDEGELSMTRAELESARARGELAYIERYDAVPSEARLLPVKPVEM